MANENIADGNKTYNQLALTWNDDPELSRCVQLITGHRKSRGRSEKRQNHRDGSMRAV